MSEPAPSPTTPAAGDASAPAPVAAKKKGSLGGTIGSILFMLSILAGMVLLQKAMVFVLLAMLPSCIAYFLDHDPRRPVFFTVTAFNFSGFFPFFMQILMSQSLSYATEEMMSNTQAWMTIYASAGVGWLLMLAGPAISMSIVSLYYRGKITKLEMEQEQLGEQWGFEKKTSSRPTQEG